MAADSLDVLTRIGRFADYFLMVDVARQFIEKPSVISMPACIAGGLDEVSAGVGNGLFDNKSLGKTRSMPLSRRSPYLQKCFHRYRTFRYPETDLSVILCVSDGLRQSAWQDQYGSKKV